MNSKTLSQRSLKDMNVDLLEKGRISYEDAYTLDLVTREVISYDDYQDQITDRRNHHSRMMRFGVQVAFSGALAAFTITMLVTGKPAEVYLPVLTGIIGYWLPAPEYSKSTRPRSGLASRKNANVSATPMPSPSPTF
jgi:hypothetical protein